MEGTTSTKRITLIVLLVAFSLFGIAYGQQPTVASTRIVTVPNGLQVIVDGQTYITPITLLWPQGSPHTIHTFNQAPAGSNTQYQFSGWLTNLGQITATADPTTVIVTADPALTEVDANFTTTYLVSVVYFNCPGYSDPGNPCPSNLTPGTVIANGQTFTQSGSFYASGALQLQATPSPGWIFDGWYNGTGTGSQAFIGAVTVTGPTFIYPRFVQGRTVTVQSSPSGLKVLADRSVVTTPSTLTWGRGTTHQLGSTPDQIDSHGLLWVFSSWDDGGGINHAYQVPDMQGPFSVTATFVPGQRVSFFTNPPGLPLTIDGRSNWLSNNFNWAVNSQHIVSAPLTTTDAAGNVYTFTSWSQGGPAAQNILVTQDPNGLNLQYTANYSGSSKISVTSQSSGVVIQVDGQDCALPCTLTRPFGSPIHLTAPPSISLTADSRLDFQGWNDSAAPDRTLNTPNGALTLNLSYALKNRLNATATPAEGATLVTDPATVDGFFDAQAQVQVTAQTKLGFKFQSWDGDVTGISRSVMVSMSSPKSVRAILNRVPALLDGAVKNAAADTPLGAVAAGSIISIYGVNLAPALQIGPASPLSQTLSNITVTISGKLLPLLFVSPEQINAQLPSDLAEGSYTLTIHSNGSPDVSTDFKVARNAPGLFNTVVNGQAFGLFLHQNGDPITSDSPAHRNETVTLLGTGFGPTLQPALEGFPATESATSVFVDPVTVVAGSDPISPTYAGAADGRVGLGAIRFTITDPLPTGTTVPIKVTAGNQDSNSVLLPLE